MVEIEIPNTLPVIPTNTKLILPGIISRIAISNKTLIDDISDDSPFLVIVPLKTPGKSKSMELYEGGEINTQDFFRYGVVVKIVDYRVVNKQPLFTVEGLARVEIISIERKAYFKAKLRFVREEKENSVELQGTIEAFKILTGELLDALKQLNLPPNILKQVRKMLDSTDTSQLSDLIISMIDSSYQEKLDILSTVNLKERLLKTLELIKRQLQLEAIKKELGEDDSDDEHQELLKKLSGLELPPSTRKVIDNEIKRLKRMNPNMAEYQVSRNYLDTILELPWTKPKQSEIDIPRARKILDQDHYGLPKIKQRIIEYLSILKLVPTKPPILLLNGPPGVGKTSLGKSIANALNRKFYRISLGGVRDESEIRGHRKTYIGSMPGIIIQALKRTGVSNPVILLDEIDKLSKDRGDPASALLEVLDPEQNHTFVDHYLNVQFDLSNIVFIATCNDTSTIPPPLLDRMELVQLSGYTIEEKLSIAKKYLLPKQIKQNGVQVSISDEILLEIITGYTREAGVRNLEREIGSVCRYLAVEYTESPEYYKKKVDKEKLVDILGPVKFENDLEENGVGVVTGLAYTPFGGSVLCIEATQSKGKGKLTLTESCQIGLSWVKSNQKQLGIDINESDIHIHLPAGATPKDGPSAGVTIITALVSMFKNQTILPSIAMTGEVTLSGKVLPVGGIKEKVLAAHRNSIKKVLLPYRNKKDLFDVPIKTRQDIQFVFCQDVYQVLEACGLYNKSKL
ncbi:hypothetical protein HK103_000355 [Boothiomyces macroporosus]|uniref:Lon protease homolog n=1 Tax=Boothiomyces macroporosus TaxID=261099 RepID=A0AAD5Y604_9FUNG|nr:hypothetical protein HK103_000355 [Boothiomyces macroporosus]